MAVQDVCVPARIYHLGTTNHVLGAISMPPVTMTHSMTPGRALQNHFGMITRKDAQSTVLPVSAKSQPQVVWNFFVEYTNPVVYHALF